MLRSNEDLSGKRGSTFGRTYTMKGLFSRPKAAQ